MRLPKPMLSEDYSELHQSILQQEIDEEGDYASPTARNYELHRHQVALSDIIGVGQFGDVYIGTCRVMRPTSKTNPAEGGIEDVISVAVKTCKADADLKTSEKFLEEACEYCCRDSSLVCKISSLTALLFSQTLCRSSSIRTSFDLLGYAVSRPYGSSWSWQDSAS
jgi:hypothetical protein